MQQQHEMSTAASAASSKILLRFWRFVFAKINYKRAASKVICTACLVILTICLNRLLNM